MDRTAPTGARASPEPPAWRAASAHRGGREVGVLRDGAAHGRCRWWRSSATCSYQAWPSLGWEFLRRRAAARACARAASGRRWSARSTWSSSRWPIAAPIGVLAAHLPERVRPGQLVHPRHQPRGDQPGRRAQHRPRPVRPRRLRATPRSFGYSILAASLTLAIMTLPVIIASTREALASVPMAFREACWNVGATRWQTIRARRPAQLDQRHPHRRHPAGQPRRRRDRADHVHRRRLLQGGRSAATCSPTASTTSAWRCPCTCTPSPPRCRTCTESMPYATAVVLLGSVLLVNATAIALRVWLRNRKKW